MKSSKKIICIIISILVFLALLVGIIYLLTIKKQTYDIEVNGSYNIISALGLRETDKIEIIKDDVNINKLGTYNLQVKINNKEKKYKINVVDTTPPKINANDINLSLGDNFNVNDYVDVTDNYDESIEKKIISNNVNVNKIGTYNVILSATDSSNNTNNKTIKVNVLDKGYTQAVAVIEYLKKHLKNPDSLIVKEVGFSSYVEEEIADYDVIIIRYSAQNGFGGMTTDTGYYNVTPDTKIIGYNSGCEMVGCNGKQLDMDIINKLLK